MLRIWLDVDAPGQDKLEFYNYIDGYCSGTTDKSHYFNAKNVKAKIPNIYSDVKNYVLNSNLFQTRYSYYRLVGWALETPMREFQNINDLLLHHSQFLGNFACRCE